MSRKTCPLNTRPHDAHHTLDSPQDWRIPLEPHLQGIETVLISPDGTVAQLPWGALPGKTPGTFLLEDLSVAVIPVPQMLPALLQQEHRSGPPESLLLAGDIKYGVPKLQEVRPQCELQISGTDR